GTLYRRISCSNCPCCLKRELVCRSSETRCRLFRVKIQLLLPFRLINMIMLMLFRLVCRFCIWLLWFTRRFGIEFLFIRLNCRLYIDHFTVAVLRNLAANFCIFGILCGMESHFNKGIAEVFWDL